LKGCAAARRLGRGHRPDDAAHVEENFARTHAKIDAMPIYEFECPDCGATFERLQKLADPDPTACPTCGKTHVKRKLTAPAFRLAGSGWYETDFKKEGDRKRNLAAKDDAPKAEAKSDAAPKAAPSGSESVGKDAKPAAAPAKAKDSGAT
jgi:putative FmdB family regulatory protein